MKKIMLEQTSAWGFSLATLMMRTMNLVLSPTTSPLVMINIKMLFSRNTAIRAQSGMKKIVLEQLPTSLGSSQKQLLSLTQLF